MTCKRANRIKGSRLSMVTKSSDPGAWLDLAKSMDPIRDRYWRACRGHCSRHSVRTGDKFARKALLSITLQLAPEKRNLQCFQAFHDGFLTVLPASQPLPKTYLKGSFLRGLKKSVSANKHAPFVSLQSKKSAFLRFQRFLEAQGSLTSGNR